MDFINKEQWDKAIEFMLERGKEDKLYASYAFILAHTQLYCSLCAKDLTNDQKEEQKIRLYKISKNVFAFNRYLNLASPDFGRLLKAKIPVGETITELTIIGEGDKRKYFDNVVAVILTEDEEKMLHQFVLELKSVLFNI